MAEPMIANGIRFGFMPVASSPGAWTELTGVIMDAGFPSTSKPEVSTTVHNSAYDQETAIPGLGKVSNPFVLITHDWTDATQKLLRQHDANRTKCYFRFEHPTPTAAVYVGQEFQGYVANVEIPNGQPGALMQARYTFMVSSKVYESDPAATEF